MCCYAIAQVLWILFCLQTVGSTDPKAIIPSREIPAGMLDRKDLDRDIFTELEQQKGLCVINFYQREVDDARKYMGWAQKLERIPVFEPDCAWLIYKFFQMTPRIYHPGYRSLPAGSCPSTGMVQGIVDHISCH